MAGKINVPITTAVQGLVNTQRQLGQLSNGIATVGRTAGVAAIAYAAFAGGLKAADFAVNAIAGARDLERNMLGLKTVFETVEPQMRQFAREAEQVGLSLNEASKSSVFIGSVLKQSGFSIQETADLTERLVRLGTDLSLTYGYDVQEALLGMTALFRGEYDPIEKFGVAMKQSEINSELAARGLDNLEGAARRFAEQQIRVELLFQRSQDAQGAFERGAGTLAVEQLRLQAVFNNMRDTVAEGLLPAIGLLTQSFREALEGVEPDIKASFEALEPILWDLGNVLLPILFDGIQNVLQAFEELLNRIEPLLDPTDKVGEAINRLVIQIESLFLTLSTTEATDETINSFELLGEVLAFVIGLFERIIYWIEVISVRVRVFQERIASLFNMDWDTFFKNWDAYGDAELRQLEITKQGKLAQDQYNRSLQNTQLELMKIARMPAERGRGRARLTVTKEDLLPKIGDDDGKEEGGKVAKNFVQEFLDKLKEDVAKQTAREQLELKGASKGLIDSILAGEGWMKVWQQIKAGKLVLQDLQKEFNKSTAGVKEFEAATAEAQRKIDQYEADVKRINKKLADDLADIAEKATEAKNSFADMLAGFAILPTIEREIGKFEAQVVGFIDEIRDSLKRAFENKDILEKGYNNLREFANKELALLAQVARQRDELAERFDLAEGLIANYKKAFTAAANLTQLFSNLKTETETRTVTSITRGIVRLGSSLREFEVTVSRSFEETIGGVQDKAKGVLDGFRELAAKSRAFAENLRKLREMGLDPMLFNQLIDAGVEAGGETAQALVEGGSATISELNDLFKEIDTIGGTLGEEVATTLYGTGIDLANGLLEGIRSKQQELEDQARSMAEAFNTAFRSALNLQVDEAQRAAEQIARDAAQKEIDDLGAKPVLPTLPEIAEETVKQVAEKATAAVKKASQAITKAATPTRSTSQVVQSPSAMDLYKLSPQLPTAVPFGGTGRGTITNNYVVQVTSDSRTSGTKAGEAIVEQLQKFGSANAGFNVRIQ